MKFLKQGGVSVKAHSVGFTHGSYGLTFRHSYPALKCHRSYWTLLRLLAVLTSSDSSDRGRGPPGTDGEMPNFVTRIGPWLRDTDPGHGHRSPASGSGVMRDNHDTEVTTLRAQCGNQSLISCLRW